MVHHHGVIDRKTDLKLDELHVGYPGSKPNARTPQGLTALDLARNYKNTHLLESLEQTRAAR